MGKRFGAVICAALFAIAGCGTPAAKDAGVLPAGKADVATLLPAALSSAPAAATTATAAPTAKPVGVVFTSVRSPVSRNGTGLAAVSTAPNTSCSIVVTYKSGQSSAQGLIPKTSDGAGAVSWTWNIGATTTLGEWPIDVTCGGVRGHATFVVQ